MKDNNPFEKVTINKENSHEEVEFDFESIKFRATLNYTDAIGRLSRGTLGIVDPETGYLLQKDPNAQGRAFSTAIQKTLIIPMPASGQKQSDVIWPMVVKVAKKLIAENASRLKIQWRDYSNLQKLTVGQALDAYEDDYIADRSDSANMRKMYRNRLNDIANFLEGKQIEEIKKKDLKQFCEFHKSKNAVEYVYELNRFLEDTAIRIGTERPTKVTAEFLEKSNRKKKPKDDFDKQDRDVVNADILPEQYERELDKKCWDHIKDPNWAAAMTMKETGLKATDICKLKIKNFCLYPENVEKVFLLYRRGKLTTGTIDYTFPLSPAGGRYINEYISNLRKQYGENRVHDEAYLFSDDPDGNMPLDPSSVNSFIRREVSTSVFGYIGKVPLAGDLTISMRADLLTKTREKHLRDDCGLAKDPDALCFMKHLSMAKKVQSDHYRSFTDPTGREYLWRMLRQDRHGLPERSTSEKPSIRRSSRARYDQHTDEVRFPPETASTNDQIYVVRIGNLKEGDIIETITSEGCFARKID